MKKRVYLDSSAAIKLVVDESESADLSAFIDRNSLRLIGSLLLVTELRRATYRIPELTQDAVSEMLSGFEIYNIPPAAFYQAGWFEQPNLRSLDAIHVASAMALKADLLITYDKRMLLAAQDAHLNVSSPGF